MKKNGPLPKKEMMKMFEADDELLFAHKRICELKQRERDDNVEITLSKEQIQKISNFMEDNLDVEVVVLSVSRGSDTPPTISLSTELFLDLAEDAI
jgi:hypothetical protein